MEKILLQQTKVTDPEGPFHNQLVDIIVSDKEIISIGEPGSLSNKPCDRQIDARSTYFSPGWVDTGLYLQDPGQEWKESQNALAQAALFGGFTCLVPYPTTVPIPENGEIIKGLVARFRELPVHVFPMGVATEHREGKEMAGLYDMHEAGAIAFSDGPLSLSHGGTILRILRYLQSFGGLLVTGGITPAWATEGQMNEGPVSTSLGLPGIPSIAEKISIERDLNILQYINAGNIHFSPLSSPEAIKKVIAAESKGMNVSVGLPIYLLAFSDEDLQSYDENLKVMPPLRTDDERKQLIKLVREGMIDILSSGHKAEGMEEKLVEFSQAETGMLGLQTAFPLAVSSLLKEGHIKPEDWVRMVSLAPRKRFGLSESHIEASATEWTWFDLDSSWSLNRKKIPSRAKNSPLLDQNLHGKVKAVGVKGKVHFFD